MAETIKIECSGYSVDADWYAGNTSDEIVLVLIGWASSRKSQSNLIEGLMERTGMSVLTFDYSGHGDSPIDINGTRPAQHFLEVIYVFDWLRNKYPNAKVTVVGASYGGYLATQLTKYRTFEKLILRVPAIYLPSDFYTSNDDLHNGAGRKRTDAFRLDSEALAKHPLLARAGSFKGKTLVVVHENDERVPKSTTDAYIKAFGADVYVAKGMPHSLHDIPSSELIDYQAKISDWLRG
ncbi:MAG: alpha/beta fold hydrolase [Candidatus Saccharimonadales bacterium]